MKVLISILIVVAVGWGAWKIWDHWQRVNEQEERSAKAAEGAEINPEQLPGLPYQLATKLQEAKQAGPAALKRFIESCKRFPDVKDPRLAWIELDYVVMISGSDPLEAKKIFADVKQRTPTNSVIYPRIRSLEKTYE